MQPAPLGSSGLTRVVSRPRDLVAWAARPYSPIPGFEILIKNCAPCVDGQQLRVAPPGRR